MDQGKIKQFFVRLYEKTFDEDIPTNAASVGFYFMFALFPLLLFLLTLCGLVLESAADLRQELFVYLRQVMPASALELVQKTLDEVVQGSSGGKLTLGFVVALWSASAGIDSLGIALNSVYKLKETRPYWKRKGISILLTLAIALLIAIALGIIFYGTQFLAFILTSVGLPVASPLFLKILSFTVVAVVLVIAFALIYTFCPNHKPFSWHWITPGSVIAIILWVLFSGAFRLYLSYFDSYAATYGSLGAIIILMLWLYLTAFVILIGGAANAILNEFSIGKYEKMSDDEVETVNDAGGDEHPMKADRETHAKTIEKLKTAVGGNDSPNDAEGYINAPSYVKDADEPEKSKLNVVIGAVIASVIGIFKYKNKK